jgi:thiopurine S-methyltransferase
VEAPDVAELFSAPWQALPLERRDILDQEPRFRAEGVSALATAVYRLRKS